MNRKTIGWIAGLMVVVFLTISVAYPLLFNPDAQKAETDVVPVAPPQPSPTAPAVGP